MQDLQIYFDNKTYRLWANRCMTEKYAGYRKAGYEQPDAGYGSGYEYTHIAPKYLKHHKSEGWFAGAYRMLSDFQLAALNWAIDLGVGPDLMPSMEDSTLRLLRYPPGATSQEHTDFCLFTLPLWRNQWDNYRGPKAIHHGEVMQQAYGVEATPHAVTASNFWQYSAVYFVMPKLDAKLPSGETVNEWVTRRKEETRNAA